MDYDVKQSPFSKSLLTGLFAGIVATVICLAYNIFYRETTGFLPADFINVSSIIFVVNLVFLVFGAIYFIFLSSFKKGEIIFIVLFVLLTLLGIWKAGEANRGANHLTTMQFRGLLMGIVIISGICAAFLLP